MEMKFIDNGHYRISDIDANKMLRLYPSSLTGKSDLRWGFERRVKIEDEWWWLTRTQYRCYADAPSRGWVYAVYKATKQNG